MKVKNFMAAILCGAGWILPLIIVLICLPLTIPRLFGYEIYAIISGSMEPTIPVGSVVYTSSPAAEEIVEGDVIVFYGGRAGEAVTTHRVVENRIQEQEFITRGDANAGDDMLARPYDTLIGRVERTVPVLGQVFLVLSDIRGKAYLVCILAASILFQIVGRRLRAEG